VALPRREIDDANSNKAEALAQNESTKRRPLYENQYLCVDAGIACVGRLRQRTDRDNYDNYTRSDNDRASPGGGGG
jgi:hypothetical protein